jgi:kinesin family protein 6/9
MLTLVALAACARDLQVSLNEAVDPAAIIARLRQEVRDLKEELALLRGSAAPRGPLTGDELQRLRQQLQAYVDDPSAAAGGGGAGTAEGGSSSSGSGSSGGVGINLGGDMMMVHASECFTSVALLSP